MDRLQLAKAVFGNVKDYLPDKTFVDVYNWLNSTTVDEELESQLRSCVMAKELKRGEIVNGRRIPDDLPTETKLEYERYLNQGGKMILIEYRKDREFVRILQYHDLEGKPITEDSFEKVKGSLIDHIILPRLSDALADEYLKSVLA